MAARAALLAALLLTAGCVGLDTRTGTPTPDRTPPGVDDGRVNATRLVAAHERSLAGRPVVVERTESYRSTVAGERNRSTRIRVRTDGDGRSLTRVVTHTADGRRATTRWRGVDRGVRAVEGDPRERIRSSLPTTRLLDTRPLRRWLATGRYTVVSGTAEPPRRVVLSARRYAPPDGEPTEADRVHYEARAVVTARGRVTAFRARLVTVETNKWGRQRRVQAFSYRVVRTGDVGVDRPDWVPGESG